MPERKKTAAETASNRVSDMNSPLYCRIEARITPLIMGPRTCPTSIMVFKKPIEVPTKFWGVSSHIKGAVEEITMAKPKPYPIEIASNSGNCVVNGTKNKRTPLIMHPKTIGKLLLLLSEKRPIIGLDKIRDTICIPITTDTANALKPATCIMYCTK